MRKDIGVLILRSFLGNNSKYKKIKILCNYKIPHNCRKRRDDYCDSHRSTPWYVMC